MWWLRNSIIVFVIGGENTTTIEVTQTLFAGDYKHVAVEEDPWELSFDALTEGKSRYTLHNKIYEPISPAAVDTQ